MMNDTDHARYKNVPTPCVSTEQDLEFEIYCLSAGGTGALYEYTCSGKVRREEELVIRYAQCTNTVDFFSVAFASSC